MVTFAAKNAITFLGRLLVSISPAPCMMTSVAAWFLSQSALNICIHNMCRNIEVQFSLRHTLI